MLQQLLYLMKSQNKILLVRKIILTIAIGGLVYAVTSCSSQPVEASENTALEVADSLASEEEKPYYDTFQFDTLRGVYTGDFGDGFINVVLTYVNERKAVGYNIHKGLKRNLVGSVKNTPDYIELTLNEPGDNEYDGVFALQIDKKKFHAKGTWTPNSSKLKVRNFELNKKTTPQSDGKSIYDGGEFNETEFLNLFSYAQLGDGNLEFDEAGSFKYSYYPEYDEVNRKEQLVVVRGSWKFMEDNTVFMVWGSNSPFKEKNMRFRYETVEDSYPQMKSLNSDHLITVPYF